jgi:hypothetical protein
MKVVITDDEGFVIFEADRDAYVAPSDFNERATAMLCLLDCMALISGMFMLSASTPFGDGLHAQGSKAQPGKENVSRLKLVPKPEPPDTPA